MPALPPKPLVLAILDGWGIAPASPGNAITQAKTPNFTSLWNSYPHTQLIAHGESVGLPKHEPGNTETGHLNIGAGSIVYQDLPRINISIADGSFFQNPVLLAAASHTRTHSSRFHLLGLVGGGGVHSDLAHFFALLRFCREQGLSPVYLHLFTDGRDSPPTASLTYVQQLQSVINQEQVGTIASIMGRYYAMDRDFRWDRTAKAYFCLTQGQGLKAENANQAVSQSHAAGITDEFIAPTLIDPEGLIKDNDTVIFVNFRIDRPRQLTKAFVLPDFERTANIVGFDPYSIKYLKKHTPVAVVQKPFSRKTQISNLFFVTMTEYDKGLPTHVIFPPQPVPQPLGQVISQNKLTQLRVSESEKERFVTYYFNGLREEPFSGEDRLIVPSPQVPTYDQKPEMSARQITSQIAQAIASAKYDLIVINYANPDMVAHTGDLPATVAACQVVDECLGILIQAIWIASGCLVVTADHGNAEEMINLTTSTADTEHNSNPVPFIVAQQGLPPTQLPQGILADIAPTLLSMLHLPLPLTMTGRNLLAGIID